jgi:hypothetical protein
MYALGRRLLIFWQKYERHINLGAVAVGFAFDFWIAKRPDSIPDNLLLLFYLLLSATAIIILNIRKLRRQMERERPTETILLILALQFCFGGLANNMLILYGKSGTLGVSLLFVGILAAFGIGNEFLKSRYDQLRFNIAIYYFLLLTYCVMAVPTFILHKIGDWVFLSSVAVSLVLISIFLAVLFFTVFRGRERRQLLEVSVLVTLICSVFVGFYFLNIIPPVPLSLKGIGIYHDLAPLPPSERGHGALYSASFQKPQWYVFWRDTSSTFDFSPGEPAYCYSAVFAPGSLSTPIVHQWQKYDAETGAWATVSEVQFPITGGRANGYLGYSEQQMSPGQWRCDVETMDGQLIGRMSFNAIEGTAMSLSTTTL